MVSRASAVLSRSRKMRSIPSSAINGGSRDGGPAAAPGGSAPGASLPPGGGQSLAAGLTRRSASRRALKNWKVRSRLFLLVVIPTVTAVAAGAIFIASSVQSAFVYGRVQTLASLSGKITGLVQALQTERQDTVRFIVLGSTNGG